MGSYLIFAESNREGEFEQLTILEREQITCLNIETDDGTDMCEYVEKGVDKLLYYIDVIEFKGTIDYLNSYPT